MSTRSEQPTAKLILVTLAAITLALLWQGCMGVVPGALTADAGPDQSVGIGQTITLRGEAEGGSGGYTYSWSPTTGLSNPTAAHPVFTGTTVGVQTFTLTVRDSAGSTATDTTRVETASQPLTAEAGPDQTATVGDTVLMQGFASGGVGTLTFQWTSVPVVSPDNLLGASTLAPFFTPSDPGDYLFTLTVTDSEGFSDTDFTSVTVSP